MRQNAGSFGQEVGPHFADKAVYLFVFGDHRERVLDHLADRSRPRRIVDFLDPLDPPLKVYGGKTGRNEQRRRWRDGFTDVLAVFSCPSRRESDPEPPAAPKAGAPRTRKDDMASASSSMVLKKRTRSSAGKRVWSMIRIVPSAQSIMRI
jgi:hypothetical protein